MQAAVAMADMDRAKFRSRSKKWRKKQIRAILNLVLQNQHLIVQALASDLGKHPHESLRDEIALTLTTANVALNNLDQWLGFSEDTEGEKGGGMVLIFSSWTYPLNSALDPTIAAVAAGHAVVLRPSDAAPETWQLLRRLVPAYVDSDAVHVACEEEGDAATWLHKRRWQRIFVGGTCMPSVAAAEVDVDVHDVMDAASLHVYVTPVTVVGLGLGHGTPATCVAVVDVASLTTTHELLTAARRIALGKWGSNNGQSCHAPNCILVHQDFADDLLAALKFTIDKFFGKDPTENGYLCRIINAAHFRRLLGFLEDVSVSDSIVYGGRHDEKKLYIQPTILLNPPLASDIMTQEIFGPLLPIITLSILEEAVEFINTRPIANSIYVFTNNKLLVDSFITSTSSGSIIVNDTVEQLALETLTIQRMGESELDKHHGRHMFQTFQEQNMKSCKGLNKWFVSLDYFKLRLVRIFHQLNICRKALYWLGYSNQYLI